MKVNLSGIPMSLNKYFKELKSNDPEIRMQAFNNIYNCYFKLVCFCVSQYVKNLEDLEEIVDDTFLSFFNNLDHLDESKNLKYYLLTIAKNKSLNYLRKNNKYTLLSDEMLLTIPYKDESFNNDILDVLKTILNYEELVIIMKHLIYGYSFKEIASYQNQSINTIMSTYRRALKKAANYLKETKIHE